MRTFRVIGRNRGQGAPLSSQPLLLNDGIRGVTWSLIAYKSFGCLPRSAVTGPSQDDFRDRPAADPRFKDKRWNVSWILRVVTIPLVNDCA